MKSKKDAVDLSAAFDRKIELCGKQPGVPRRVVDATVYVHDTLALAWAAARSVFGEDATAEAAIAIYELINEERVRLLAEDDRDPSDHEPA